MVIMGRVVAPYGIYGWLKVQPYTEALDGLGDYTVWWLGRADQWRQFELETAKTHGNVLLVKLKGICDRDGAFALKGNQIAVPRGELPPAAEGEYYWSDLIGLRVVNQQQVDLGEVIDVFETGANDVLVVQGERERLLPFVDQVVLEVDLAAKTLQVDWDAEF
ncbi:MAG TPA: ribosome maturation factor RimM [Methylophilaceae bacterium]|nr:ribosome maturation factor RimM [Methylophilaceae bacterium]